MITRERCRKTPTQQRLRPRLGEVRLGMVRKLKHLGSALVEGLSMDSPDCTEVGLQSLRL